MRNETELGHGGAFLRARRARYAPPIMAWSYAALLLGSVGCMQDVGDTLFDDAVAEAAPFPPPTQSESAPDAAVQPDAGEPLPALVDEWLSNEAMLDLLRTFKYRGAGFRAVNQRPFPSIVAPDKHIALWISEPGYAAYRKVTPDRAGSEVVLPVATVIVREVLEGNVLKTLTLMLKLPNGTFPLGGDWLYASTGPDGVVNRAEDGSPLVGLLKDCGTCHLRRSNDDYLFGTPEGYLGEVAAGVNHE
jgi:hypothetical protein